MNSQELILDRIAAAIDADEQLILVVDRQYANTGTLRTLGAANLKQVAQVSYDFQGGYCKFDPEVASHWYGKPATLHHVSYVKSTIPEVIDAVVAHLRGES